MTRSILFRAISVAVLAGFAADAGAMGVMDAYVDALHNDPVYQSAGHERDSGVENRVLGRSNLLPNVQINYSGSKNFAETAESGFPASYPRYVSSSGGLNVKQPLYSPDSWARYREGVAQAEFSEIQFSGATRDLAVRVVSAYLDALYTEDYLKLITAQRNTLVEQRKVNDRMFQDGEGTRTDMLETQAKLDLAEAQLIEAQDSAHTNFQGLAALVGHDVNSLDGLVDEFQPQVLEPHDFESWRQLAMEHNQELAAQRKQVEIARQEIARNRAGQLPHVDFVAGVNRDRADTIDTYTTDSTVKSFGVQVTVPIYAGGSVSALTRQASAQYEKAKSDLDDKINQLTLDMHKQYYSVQSSIAKIAALEKSVASARLLVSATTQSIKGGVRVNLDLLNAEQQLYSSLRDLTQARFNYLVSGVKLRADAGVLTIDDLQKVAANFSPGH